MLDMSVTARIFVIVDRELTDISGADEALSFLNEAYRTRVTRAGRDVEHPIAVGRLLFEDGQPTRVVVVGLLHDVLEDTDATAVELEDRFGADVTRLVCALTQDSSIGGYKKRKAALRRQIVEAGPEAATASLADKLAKLRSGQSRPATRKLVHYRETLDAIEARYGSSRLSVQLREQLEHWPPR
jgi:(p)ppGpp synthase/HD superfamily hydrolase